MSAPLSRFEKLLDSGFMVVSGGIAKRRLAVIILRVYIGVCGEKLLDDGLMAVLCGIATWRPVVAIIRVCIELHSDQLGNCFFHPKIRRLVNTRHLPRKSLVVSRISGPPPGLTQRLN